MPILIISFRAFIFREVGDWQVIWLGITDRGVLTMISMRSTRSRAESYDRAVNVGWDGRWQAPRSPAASAADFLTCLLILWLQDGVSEHGTRLGIVPVKIDNRICGCSAAFAVFLDMGGANDLQRTISRERCQCGQFGTARAAYAPRRLEHP